MEDTVSMPEMRARARAACDGRTPRNVHGVRVRRYGAWARGQC